MVLTSFPRLQQLKLSSSMLSQIFHFFYIQQPSELLPALYADLGNLVAMDFKFPIERVLVIYRSVLKVMLDVWLRYYRSISVRPWITDFYLDEVLWDVEWKYKGYLPFGAALWASLPICRTNNRVAATWKISQDNNRRLRRYYILQDFEDFPPSQYITNIAVCLGGTTWNMQQICLRRSYLKNTFRILAHRQPYTSLCPNSDLMDSSIGSVWESYCLTWGLEECGVHFIWVSISCYRGH